MYINSPYGVRTSGMAIYDSMTFIKSPVSTICIGQAASMGAFLLAAGEPGKRFILPEARVMIHQPSSGTQGQLSDIAIAAEELIRIKLRLNELLAKHTGQDLKTVQKDTDRDDVRTATEAVKYGVVEKVLKTL